MDGTETAAAIRSNSEIPLSLKATQNIADWRNDFCWPVTLAERRDHALSDIRFALDRLTRMTDENSRRITTLASASYLTATSRVLDTALTLAASERMERTVRGGGTEADFLAGASDMAPIELRQQKSSNPNLRLLRSLRHSRRWTSMWRLPAALVAADATVLSLNELLIDCARRSDLRLDYADPRQFLSSNRSATASDQSWAAATAREWASEAVERVRLPEPIAGRARALIERIVGSDLRQAISTMAALRQQRLPANAWAGTGGNFTSRALGLEIMRRGGQMTRFNHGGSAGLTAYSEKLAFLEFTASTAYVAPTAALAEIIDRDQQGHGPGFANVTVTGGVGDPFFARVPARSARSRPARPHVTYVTALFPGRQLHYPPVPPDPVYLDWQLRLISVLKQLPVELTCRPHPENLVFHDRQPLAGAAPLTDASYREVLASSDVLVFDWALTTTFWETLCSDRPMVLIDVSGNAFHPRVKEAIERRCRVVPTTTNARNLPEVDTDTLAAAVCDAPRNCDPSEIRALLAGPT